MTFEKLPEGIFYRPTALAYEMFWAAQIGDLVEDGILERVFFDKEVTEHTVLVVSASDSVDKCGDPECPCAGVS